MRVQRWSVAVFLLFATLGFGFGAWLSRLPSVRDHLGATTLEMSLLVLSMGVGGAAEALRIPVPLHIAATYAVVVVVGVLALRRVPRNDAPDRAPGRPSSRAPGAEPDVAPIGRTGSVVTGPIPTVGTTASADAGTDAGAGDAGPGIPRSYSPWRDARIYLIGLIALSMSLGEGTGSDWIALAAIDGRGFSNSQGTLTVGVFFAAMVLTRFCGGLLIERFGRVAALRGSALLFAAGVVLVILVPVGWVAVIGVALWGAGCALGFPVSVAAVSMMAYGAYLIGPPMIGILGEHFGLLQAFWPLALCALLSALIAGSARARPASQER
ncbi:MFS transporter [Leucobacter soli]